MRVRNRRGTALRRWMVGALALLILVPAGAAGQSSRLCPSDTKLRNTNVRKGETLTRVAQRVKVAPEDLKKWNRLRTDQVRAGQNLRYCVPVWKPTSKGSCNKGSLEGGRHLDPDGDHQGVGFVVSPTRKALFGTRETVSHIKDCCAKYRRKFPKGAPINIGDLSAKDGGHLGNHVSHQSGRDVDMGYLTNPPQRRGYFSHAATRKNLDVPKQWYLVSCLLDKPDTMYIFLSMTVHAALKEYVAKTPALKRKYWHHFQRGTVLRPDTEHLTHLHVRFRCPKGDKHCRD